MCSQASLGAAPPWSLRVRGSWQLSLHGAEVSVATRERRLLSLLALRGEASRSVVTRSLWPDSEHLRAHGNLRAAVWRVQHFQSGVLSDRHGNLGLDPSVRLDVRDLREVARQLVVENHPSLRADVSELLRTDEVLPGWDEDWVLEERELLRQLHLRALENLARCRLEQGDLDGALVAALRAVAMTPCGRALNAR